MPNRGRGRLRRLLSCNNMACVPKRMPGNVRQTKSDRTQAPGAGCTGFWNSAERLRELRKPGFLDRSTWDADA